MSDLLDLHDVRVEYRRDGARVRAVDGVDLRVRAGEIVGLVGESGCGKSSLGRAALGLEALAGGSVSFLGEPVGRLRRGRRPAALRRLQMVFQDPQASLNPRRTVGDLVADGVRLGGASRDRSRQRAVELIERVGLSAGSARRYPHEFSGGQRQRIAIARTLAADPSCIVADEPISALDASAQASIANLLTDLVRRNRIGLLLISHDLSVVRQVADRVAVMYLGRIVETGPTEQVWSDPRHPYTQALVAAIPRPDGPGRPTTRLPVPSAMPDRGGSLPDNRSGAGRGRRPGDRVSAARCGAGVSAADPGGPGVGDAVGADPRTRRLRDHSGWQDMGGYSRAVRRAGFVAVSGTTAHAPDGSALFERDTYRQTRHCLDVVLRAVESLGGRRADVVRTRILLAPGADWAAATRAHGEVFAADPPANSTYYVGALIGVGFLVEVEADALIPPEDLR